jgi:hypothetical protein
MLVSCQNLQKRHHDAMILEDGGPFINKDTLPEDIAEQLSNQGYGEVGFLILHDIKNNSVKLLVRKNNDYRQPNDNEKKEIDRAIKERREEKSTDVNVKTVKVNPKCQAIIIDGSIEYVCKHIN